MAAPGNQISSNRGADRHLSVIPDEWQQHAMQDEYLRMITDSVSVLIAYIDTDERYRFVNAAYESWFCRPRSEIVGRTMQEMLGPLYPELRPHIAKALAGERACYEVSTPDALGRRHVLVTYTPDQAEDGTVRGFSSTVMDITERKNAEQVLREREKQLHRREREFKTLVENSPDIISRIDRQMRHLYVNPAIEKLTGIKASACLGKTKAELGLPATVVSAWDAAASAAFSTGQEQRLDFDHLIDGQMRYFSGRVIPEIDRHGQVESVVGIAYDVSERARMEKERDELLIRERAARIQAETAARARDEFLAIVSHELRAPLNGIQSWAHVLENYLKDATSAPLAQRALAGIKTGVGQQVRLIEDLLDVTRMMSGKLRLVKQPLALLPLLQAAVENVQAMAAAKSINLTCTYRITSEQIEGDSDRMQQIFWNLLSNAIKFTPPNGHVWLTASHIDHNIHVMVRDDGIGIPAKFLPQLFDRFSQADTSSTRDHSGLGLGLFLVRHLAELHGGSIRAESEGEDRGTTFTVQFPLRVRNDKYNATATLEDSGAVAGPLPSLNGARILLIDDQAEARESLTVLLTAAGADVFAAESALQALAWLPTIAGNALPHVLICDIAMPGEDGYAALRKLRSWKLDGEHAPLQRLPALALTAFAQREDRIRALAAGFQMHMTKPVAPEELIVVIDAMVVRN